MTLDLDTIDTSALDGLSEAERKAALSMLAEISETGRSKALEEMEYADYEEIPVDIGTFLTDPEYLGRGLTNEEGKFTVFPYWVKTLKRLFPTNVDTAYNTLILTGGIGLGKSLCAVLCQLYLLYRMMCLKDPYMHYGLQPIDKITFSLMNITIDAAKGVAWDKMQQLLQSSEWFMQRGTMKGTSSKYWAPPKGIELIVGSRNNHILGRAVFCLDGDTEVLTTDGVAKIRDLVGKEFRPISIDGEGNWVEGDSCSAQPTGKTNVEYELELEDGSIIKCTPNHRFMLKDGSYKEAKDLSEDDELFDFNMTYDKFIQGIIRSRGQWNIPKGSYFEVHHIIPKCLGGIGDAHKCRRGEHHPNLIMLYPREHFIAHMLLVKEHPECEQLIRAWSAMAFPKGKTKRDFAISPLEYEYLRNKCRELLRGNQYGKGRKPWNTGLSKETDPRLRKMAEQKKGKKRRTEVTPEERKRRSEAIKRRFALHPEQFKSARKGLVVINNGHDIAYIHKADPIPQGWNLGDFRMRGKKRDWSKYHSSLEMQERKKASTRGQNNPMYGKGYKLAKGANGHAIYIYTFEGIDYQCRDDLMVILKIRWPSISESTIRRIMSGKYTKRITNKFQYVIDNLTWRRKNEDKANN